MDKRAVALRFVEFGDGCMVPLSHKMNQDGYFRKAWADGPEMFHRFIWRAHHGPIPEGFEINHLCGNRACQNVKHFECIDGTEHAVKTNLERYSHIQEAARKYWEETGCNGATLSRMYSPVAYHWLRKWKAECSMNYYVKCGSPLPM
jgi:hypothetical protein